MGQAGVGMAFYHGAGVEQNYEKAFKYFQLSADQGYVEGQLMLGIMYYKGEGVKRDYKMAVKWFQAASQSGHALGYYNLGQMHATGTGVLRSCTTATELFKNVAERGKWSNMFIEAYNLYRQGHIEQAFMKYLYLAYLLDQIPNQLIHIYKNKDERYRRALIYWNRAALQGFHTARVKLGDYFY
jgi:SEL1 protein